MNVLDFDSVQQSVQFKSSLVHQVRVSSHCRDPANEGKIEEKTDKRKDKQGKKCYQCSTLKGALTLKHKSAFF